MLKGKMKDFALKYLETADVYTSSIYAGYSESYAKTKAYALLDRQDIQEYLNSNSGHDEVKEMITDDDEREYNIASAGRVLEFFSDVLEGRVKNEVVSVVHDSEGNGEVIISKVRPQVRDRIEAGKQLAKRFGLDKIVENLDTDEEDDIIRVELVDGRKGAE